MRRLFLSAAVAFAGLAALLPSRPAEAFPHVVEPGETLAKIAERFYGRIQLERVLVTANRLEQSGVRRIAPGMLLEIPAVTYHQVGSGESWKSIARAWLGDERRAIFLAETNGGKPWIEPELGQILKIPYNLGWVASGQESLATLAYRFLGSTKHAWPLALYNDLEKRDVVRGEILLLPLTELPLTPEGRAAAERAEERLRAETRADALERQHLSREGLRELGADVRSGRYVSAVALGTSLVASGQLSIPQRAQVARLLLEAYVALETPGPARDACEQYKNLDPDARFDPVLTSPKIIAACDLTQKDEPAEEPAP